MYGGCQVHKGSELWLLNAVPVGERTRKLDAEGTRRELQLENLVLRHVVCDFGVAVFCLL